MDKVAVIQGLQPEIGELQIPLGFQCFTQHVEVKLGEVRCQQFQLNAALDKRLQRLRVIRAHLRLGGAFCHAHKAQAFRAQIIQQQSRSGVAVVGLLLNQCACCDHQ